MTPSRAGKKILVADDSLTIQKVIRLALSNDGYEIQAVSDGNEAVQQIAVFRPDVVLIDVSLPGLSAFEVKERINQEQDARPARFILMSSAFEGVDEEKAQEVFFHGRLTKPFDPAHLRQVLSQVLAGAGDAEPEITDRPVNRSVPNFVAPPKFTGETEEPSLRPAIPGATPFAPPPPPPPAAPTATFTPPPPPPPSGDDLWGSQDLATQDLTATSGAETTADPFSEFSPDAEGDDIRGLTESTIRMSGLDDLDSFDWSVNDSSKRLSPSEGGIPSLQPPRGMHDLGGATFRFDEPAPAPAPERTKPLQSWPPEHLLNEEDNTPPEHDFQPLQQEEEEHPTYGAAAHSAASAAIDADAIQAMVERQVRETLERMAQKILPEVAERVIKQEIHRLLEEAP